MRNDRFCSERKYYYGGFSPRGRAPWLPFSMVSSGKDIRCVLPAALCRYISGPPTTRPGPASGSGTPVLKWNVVVALQSRVDEKRRGNLMVESEPHVQSTQRPSELCNTTCHTSQKSSGPNLLQVMVKFRSVWAISAISIKLKLVRPISAEAYHASLHLVNVTLVRSTSDFRLCSSCLVG